MLAAIVRASLRNPRIVTALACLIAALGTGRAGRGAVRRVSGFRAAACAGADRGAGPRCDPGRGAGHAAFGRAAGRHRECEDGAFHVEPRSFGDPSGVRPRRRSVPPAASRYRALGRVRRPAAAGGGGAAVVALEFLDGIPGAFRLHQRPALAGGAARRGAMDRQAADSCGSRRGAGADFRRRSARAADRSRSGKTGRGRLDPR